MKHILACRWLWLVCSLCYWSSSFAAGQVLDPDVCLYCKDVPTHFAGGAVADQLAALAFKKPWQRVTVAAAAGFAFELGQWDSHRADGLNGQRGYGVGLKDVAVDVLGALAREWVWSHIQKRRR